MAFYFASDTHAGLVVDGKPTGSETRLVEWLDAVKDDAEAIFLLGDIFDFWFEYKRVVPKGFVRLLSKIAELTAGGIPVHFFPGNHDMWVGDYLSEECGIIPHKEGERMELAGKKVYLAHGDNVTADKGKVRLMQKVFRSRTARRLFSAFIHPDAALKFGQAWSRSSRKKHLADLHVFQGEEEPIVGFARRFKEAGPVDYFVFGHLHVPVEYPLDDRTSLFVLGAWVTEPNPVYGVLSETGFRLVAFEK